MNVHSQAPDAPRGDKREAILTAALELFVTRGFDGTSVPLVAQTAEIAAGTIYRYFASKEALVNELYRDWKGRLMAALLEGFPLDAPPREQFRAFWQRITRFALAHPQATAFLELHHHARYLDAESIALERASLEPIHQLACHAQSVGAIRPVPAEAMMAMVWGAFIGLLKASRQGYLELDEAVLAQVEQCLWDAVRLPGATDPSEQGGGA